jgi:addiction module HigA family antidote
MAHQAVSFEPDWAAPPGQLLADTIEHLGMTQSDLAARTGLSTKHINQVIKQSVPISPQVALHLERATGVSATIWNRMEADFRVMTAREEDRKREEHQHWLERFDLRELAERGILRATDRSGRVEELLAFFGVADAPAFDRVWSNSFATFRRSPSLKAEPDATAVWLRLGQLRARSVDTEPFDASALRVLLPQLATLTLLPPDEGLHQACELLAGVGVAVVRAAEFTGCRASGAAWWATPSKAVILLSNRGKREDRIWFTLFHELAHVLLHAKRDTFIDETTDEPDDTPVGAYIDDGTRDAVIEEEADRFAGHVLIPQRYEAELAAISSKADVNRLAAAIGISPGIVAGRVQHDTGRFHLYNEFRRTVPDALFD